MTDKAADHGEYGVVSGPGTIRFERVLPGPIERVWAHLTESEKRARWLAGGEMELRVGGRVELNFRHADLSGEKTPPPRYSEYECGAAVTGRVTRCDPPHKLGMTWVGPPSEESEVTFELTPRGQDVLLVVTHSRLADRDGMLSVAAGWHAHVSILIDVLHGREPRGFWTMHCRLEREYAERIPAM